MGFLEVIDSGGVLYVWLKRNESGSAVVVVLEAV